MEITSSIYCVSKTNAGDPCLFIDVVCAVPGANTCGATLKVHSHKVHVNSLKNPHECPFGVRDWAIVVNLPLPAYEEFSIPSSLLASSLRHDFERNNHLQLRTYIALHGGTSFKDTVRAVRAACDEKQNRVAESKKPKLEPFIVRVASIERKHFDGHTVVFHVKLPLIIRTVEGIDSWEETTNHVTLHSTHSIESELLGIFGDREIKVVLTAEMPLSHLLAQGVNRCMNAIDDGFVHNNYEALRDYLNATPIPGIHMIGMDKDDTVHAYPDPKTHTLKGVDHDPIT